MKLRTLIIVATIAAPASGAAFAQTGNADSSAHRQEMMKQNEMMNQGSMANDSEFRGMAMKPNQPMDNGMASPSKHKDVSPAAPDAGVKQEK